MNGQEAAEANAKRDRTEIKGDAVQEAYERRAAPVMGKHEWPGASTPLVTFGIDADAEDLKKQK